MQIVGASAVRTVDINELNYYFIDGLDLRFFLANGNEIKLSYSNYKSVRQTSDQFFEIYYKQLGTFPDANGRCYIVNIDNVSSHSAGGTTLTINFQLSSLIITGTTPERTTQDNKALSKYIFGWNFLSSHTGGFIYVNPDGTENYTTITAAVAGRTGNQAIRVRPGTYNETIIIDGFTIYLEAGVLITGGVGFEETGNLLGYGDFRQPDDLFGANLGEDVYIEFRNIEGGDRTFFYVSAIVKGYSVVTYGIPTIMLDTDGTVFFDFDCVKCITSGANTFIQYSTEEGYCTLRNGYYESTNSAPQVDSFDVPQMMKYNFINARFNNSTGGNDSSNFNSIYDEEPDEVNVWQSIFYTGGLNNFVADQNISFNFYGRNICNKGGNSYIKNNGSILEVNADLEIYEIDFDSGLTIINYSYMVLSNKPYKSKFTIGDIVFYNNTGAISQLTINAVNVEVDNPNDDTAGRQINTYGVNEISGTIAESKLFASKNSLLKNLKGDYLNKDGSSLLITNSIDSFNSSLNFLDISGFSFHGFTFNDIDPVQDPGGQVYDFSNVTVDDCNFTGAIFPANADTKSELKALVKSYDALTTIYKDGRPIVDWRGLTFPPVYQAGVNTVTNSAGSVNVVGTTTIFLSTLQVGDLIKIGTEVKRIATITDNTNLTVETAFTFANTSSAWSFSKSCNLLQQGADLTGVRTEGADFSLCKLPTNADTKTEFKALVASWDAVTTIWTDGLPIG